MATYVTLLRYTDQGIKTFREGPARLDAAKKTYQAQGCEMKAFYLMMGPYDMLVVADAPSDEAASKAALEIGARGAVRTETYRAFSEAEYRRIVDSLT